MNTYRVAFVDTTGCLMFGTLVYAYDFDDAIERARDNLIAEVVNDLSYRLDGIEHVEAGTVHIRHAKREEAGHAW